MILRFCVCIPTYDNPATIDAVIRDCLFKTTYPILVIDDGSKLPVRTDWDSRVNIVRLPINRGKGAALQTAFAECLKRGFTHMISVDGDGQHLAGEIAKLTAISMDDPWSLVIGSRQLNSANVPSVSKFGRSFSNFWVRFQSNCVVSDSQSGFRIYPLFHLQNLSFWTRKFDFEIEVLIRLLWRGVGVRETAIECYYPPAGERVSHFHKFWDNLRISCLNVVLVVLSLLRSRNSPRDVALAIGIGVFIGCTPLLGFHSIIAGMVAFAFRINAIYLLIGTQISIPPLAPFLILVSITVGKWLRGPHADSLTSSSLNWIIGSMVVGTVLGLVIGALAYFAVHHMQKSSGGKTAAWNGRTRGGKFGNGFLKLVTRYAGLNTAYAFLVFVVPYFYFFAPQARRASNEYWRTVRPGEDWLTRQQRVLLHFYRFAQTLLDRVYQGFRTEACFESRANGMENILAPLRDGKGLLLMTAHVGGWDLAAASLKSDGLGEKFHMVQYESQGLNFDKARGQADPEHVQKLFSNQVQQPLLRVRELLSQNLPVGLMGDRPLGGQFELISFFGKLAPIDCTPFRVAAACEVPLLFTFGFKSDGRFYDFYASPARLYRYDPGPEKPLQVLASAQEFATTLEALLEKYPDQWFNFFPFWSSLPSAPAGVEATTARNHSEESLRTPAPPKSASEFGANPNDEVKSPA